MPHTTPARGTPVPGRHRIYSQLDCQQIAAVYDGSKAALDELLNKWRRLRKGVTRRNLAAAARRGGYRPGRARKAWGDPQEDLFLWDNWHRMSGDEIAAALGRSFHSVNLRRKRLGIGRYDGDELTVRDLESLTAIDHRQWQEFIARGWLRARTRGRRNDATPITYVSIDAVHQLLKAHPEVYEYRAAPRAAAAALELGRLPDPPAWKRVVCRSDSWQEQLKATPLGRAVTHGAAAMVTRRHRFRLQSCASEGGTRFWTRLYQLPQCPRCGCQVSRYSEEGLFSNNDPGDHDVIDIQARKLGLRWNGEKLLDARGKVINDADVLHCLFNADRGSTRSIRAFEKLVQAGMAVATANPVPQAALLANILNIELTEEQEEAFGAFVRTGNMTAAHAMSFGKSTLGLMAMTRLAGRHLLMVDTQLLREQWVEKFTAFAPRVEVRHHAKPVHATVRIFDAEGGLRSQVEIYNYASRARLGDDDWVVAAFDEVHRLPAARAHRHALVRCQYRLGMSATAELRCDGRGALVSRLTGPMVGDDWSRQMERGVVKRIPVKVLLVEDREHKHEVVGQLLRQHRKVVVLCEALADGDELQARYGIPFVSSATKHKLRVVRAAQSMVFSRIGDASLSVTDCEVTVDHSGLFGSRIQSLQRLGRLMHSHRAQYHCILMTREERYERFAKRVEAIQAKGFPVTEEVAPRERARVHSILTPTLRARLTEPASALLGPLGLSTQDLIKVA